jgi:hypothetical protein
MTVADVGRVLLFPYVEGERCKNTVMDWITLIGDALLCPLPVGHTTAYAQLLATWWNRTDGRPLMIVEHDVLPPDGMLGELERCREPWCVSPYPIFDGRTADAALGCTKFSAEIQAAQPNLLTMLADSGTHWMYLDDHIQRWLRQSGFQPHQHAASEHLRVY